MPRHLLSVLVVLAVGACRDRTPVELYVDGFVPEQVSFDVEDLGTPDAAALAAIAARADVDGAMALPAGTCTGPCHAVLISVYVTNKTKLPEPSPVVRLEVPKGRARRLPIAFSAPAIEPFRRGRVRWLVELWPEEQRLTATLTSSVNLEVTSPK